MRGAALALPNETGMNQDTVKPTAVEAAPVEASTAPATPQVGNIVTVLAVVRGVHDGTTTVQIVGEGDNLEQMLFAGPTAVVPSDLVAFWRDPMPHLD